MRRPSLREHLAESIRAGIVERRLPPGSPLPSVRALARERGVSTFTAAAVYELLVAAGVAEARRGAGYFVAGIRPRRRPRARDLPGDSLWERRGEVEGRSIAVDAGCGWLPLEWLPQKALKAALRERGRANERAGYGNPYGSQSLRRQLTTILRGRGLEVSEEQVVTTQGASQGLDLVIRECLAPGDLAVVEDPTYPPLLDLLRARGVKLASVTRTASGPDSDQLARLLKRRRAKAFFTNTVLHNPTGTTTTLPVAHRLVELADRYEFNIIEDDIFAELAPRDEACLTALDECQRLVLVSSFSKTIAADLRVGYVACSAPLARRLARAKSVSALASSEMVEELVLHVLVHGHYRRHLDSLRRKLAAAQMRVQELLGSRGVELAFRPSAGMFLWGRLPSADPAGKLWRTAAEQGVLLAPGELFRPDGRASDHWRFNVGHCDAPRLVEFLDGLAAAALAGRAA
jgi:DNA-binding transcriptional MocR family regulator